MKFIWVLYFSEDRSFFVFPTRKAAAEKIKEMGLTNAKDSQFSLVEDADYHLRKTTVLYVGP
jgi:hypothetical protein